MNKYGKVCYTNLLTQAQVLYTNFDFPTFAGENHKVLVNLTSPKSENSSDLGFSFLPSFEDGENRYPSSPHLFCSTPQCPPRASPSPSSTSCAGARSAARWTAFQRRQGSLSACSSLLGADKTVVYRLGPAAAATARAAV